MGVRRESPTVVGINRTQDASVAVACDGDVVSLQKERLTRRKHHWGRLGDLPRLYVPSVPSLHDPVDLVVECYSSDAEVERAGEYRQELVETLTFRDGVRVESISHHLAHLYSAFHPSPFDEAAVMVIDAQGSRVRDVTERWPGSAASAPELLEVASFYRCDGGGYECLGKQLWDGDWSRPVGLGCFYYLLTRMIFPGEGNEGKVMGLAPYAKPGGLGLPELGVDGFEVSIPGEWVSLFAEGGERYRYAQEREQFERAAQLAADGQAAFESALLRVAAWLRERTDAADLCFAGGTALNCSANTRLLHETGFRDLFIPPSPHDGGTALGSALYGIVAILEAPNGFRWVNDYLGPEPHADAIERAVETLPDDLVAERPVELLDAIVELLDSGRVVGLHHGRSESGPRALGDRSILADARHPGMQDYINSRVKGREPFRPLAPIVLWDAAPAIFEIDRPAPFMQIAADVKPEYRARYPAVTHVDSTARLQTVEEETTPFLYALLRAFEARTGAPVLLNTSLNGPGDPITETPEDSVACLRSTDMHALALPPYLIRKRDEPPIPHR